MHKVYFLFLHFYIGSELCSYDIPVFKYPSHGERSKKCPKLPVPPRYSPFFTSVKSTASKYNDTSETMLMIPFPHPLPLCSNSLPVFHRCTPVDISCYAQFAEAFVTFVSDNSMLHRVIAGVMASKEIIMGLCVLALGTVHPKVGFYVLAVCIAS